MKYLLPLTLGLALTVPAAAQRMGSTNQNAPTVKHEIDFGDASIAMNYVAITWAEGRTMKAIMDKEQGERARQRVNRTAERRPLGSLKTSTTFHVGDKKVPAGNYSLFFTIDDKLKWHLVLAPQDSDKRITWKLDLKDTQHKHARLTLGMRAGTEDDSGVLTVAFGKKACHLDFSFTEPDEDK